MTTINKKTNTQNPKDKNLREKSLAYDFAEWVCLRQLFDIRRATISVWAEANNVLLSDQELIYIFEHWRDYVEPVDAFLS